VVSSCPIAVEALWLSPSWRRHCKSISCGWTIQLSKNSETRCFTICSCFQCHCI